MKLFKRKKNRLKPDGTDTVSVSEDSISDKKKGTAADDSEGRRVKRRKIPWTMIPGSDPWINGAVLLLLLFGTIMIISTEQGMTVGDPQSLMFNIAKQLGFVFLAIVFMIACSRIYTNKSFGIFHLGIYAGFFLLMLAVLFFGRSIYGSKAWLYIGGISFQPSEFAKPLMIASCAYAVFRARYDRKKQESFLNLFVDQIILLIVIIGFMLLQKDIGTMIIICLITVVCMLVPGYKSIQRVQKWIWRIGLGLVLAALVFVFATSIGEDILGSFSGTYHISTRIRNMKNPYTDIYGEGYQPANSLYSIADGGVLGKGFGNSARKYGYLTQADSDYILAVIIEELGLIGLLFITVLYLIIILRLFYWAQRAPDGSSKVVLCGTAAYFGFHFIINVGGVGALIPMTGVPLLFISAGGSSILAAAIAVGMAQARIAWINRHIKKKLPASDDGLTILDIETNQERGI